MVENALYLWAGGANGRADGASGVRLLVWNCQCYSRQACCLLYCLCHINNGSHTGRFTFELLLLCFRMWLWFQISTKIFADRRIWPKKGTDLHTPIHSPLQWISLYKRRYHLSPLGLARVNPVVLTDVKICSGFR